MSKLKSLEELFGGRHFDREIIILCVRWYLRYKLSLRDLVEMTAERGLSLAHTTILRRFRYTPEFVKRWKRFATVVCRQDLPEDSWQVGLPLPRGGSARPDRGLHAQGEARSGRRQSLLQQGHQASGPVAAGHHALTRRNRGDSIESIIASINPTLRGWFGYFQHAHRYTFSSVDGFVRRRLRAILRRQLHRPGQGHCFRDHTRWPNAFFANHGLFTMSEALRFARQSRCGNN